MWHGHALLSLLRAELIATNKSTTQQRQQKCEDQWFRMWAARPQGAFALEARAQARQWPELDVVAEGTRPDGVHILAT